MRLSVGAAGAVIEVSASDAVTVLPTPDVTVIEVRTAAELSSGHLAGAVNIEGDTLGQQVADLPKTTTYFVYRRGGGRSCVAPASLARLGFTSVYNLHDGIVEWQAGGAALATS
jgi:rhodanese-related sulfurtransferase